MADVVHDETTDAEAAFDGPTVERLARWMDAQGLAGEGEIPGLVRLGGGSQNELFRVTRGGESVVLRTRPAGSSQTQHDGLRRELRLLRGLKGTDVPHGELVAGEEDDEVLGGPFYLMKEIIGWSPSGEWPEPYNADVTLRRSLGLGLMEGCAKLARVDWRAQGLEGFGRPDHFHDRQVDRWLAFLDNYRFRELPGLDDATEWLRRNRPRHWEPGIMHGDYQFANVMFTNDVPAGLAAVIDWEMTTIGDPLLDVAWATLSWGPDGDDMYRYLDYTGMPTLEEMLEHYESISGRSTEDFDYYLVLARWKLGIVLEMTYAKVASGELKNSNLESFGPYVLDLIRKAGELSRSLSGKGHWK